MVSSCVVGYSRSLRAAEASGSRAAVVCADSRNRLCLYSRLYKGIPGFYHQLSEKETIYKKSCSDRNQMFLSLGIVEGNVIRKLGLAVNAQIDLTGIY